MSKAADARWRTILVYFGLYGFMFLVFVLSVRSGDDLGRAGQFQKFVSEGTILSGLVDFHQLLNGRVLGNALHLLLVDFRVLTALVQASISVGIVWTISRLARVRYLPVMPLVALLVLAPSLTIFKQATVWAAGYFNYVPSVLFIFLAILIFRDIRSRWAYPAILILATMGCLFSENVTVALSIFTVIIGVVCLVRRTDRLRALALLGGTAIGALLMFSSPVYRRVSNGTDVYRQVAGIQGDDGTAASFLQRVVDNLSVVAKTAALDPALLYLIVAIAIAGGIQFWRRSWTVSISTTLMLGSSSVLYFLSLTKFYSLGERSLKLIDGFVVLLLFVLFGSMILALFASGERKFKFAAGWVLAGLTLFLPFIVVSPFGPRNMYFTTMCLVVVLLTVTSSYFGRFSSNRKLATAFLAVFLVLAILMLGLLGMNRLTEIENRARIANVTETDTSLVLRGYPVPNFVQDWKNPRKQLSTIPQCKSAAEECAGLEIVWE